MGLGGNRAYSIRPTAMDRIPLGGTVIDENSDVYVKGTDGWYGPGRFGVASEQVHRYGNPIRHWHHEIPDDTWRDLPGSLRSKLMADGRARAFDGRAKA